MSDTDYTIKHVPYEQIVPGDNDRKKFDEQALQELAESIASEGLLQPISIRPIGNGLNCIIAGERRYRAMGLLGWEAVPAIITTLDDERASAAMLAENIHRVDLNPIEEALAFQSRMDKFGWETAEVAEKAHVTSTLVTQRLKLLRLAPEIQDLVASEQLKPAYAQVLAWYELSNDFQRLAVRELLKNPSPQVKWFNRLCGELKEKEAQAGLFGDLSLFSGEMTYLVDLDDEKPEPPPTPLTDEAPAVGLDPVSILRSQIEFWEDAAAEWDALCNSTKQKQVESAVAALRQALAAIQTATPAEELFAQVVANHTAQA